MKRDDLERLVEEFLREGGKITQCPPQEKPDNVWVRSENTKSSMYDPKTKQMLFGCQRRRTNTTQP